jgi:hypothetical protein
MLTGCLFGSSSWRAACAQRSALWPQGPVRSCLLRLSGHHQSHLPLARHARRHEHRRPLTDDAAANGEVFVCHDAAATIGGLERQRGNTCRQHPPDSPERTAPQSA